MMMMIFSVIAMYIYPYSAVCLRCRFLNSIYFKEHLWLRPNIAYAYYSVTLRNLNYVNHSPNGKGMVCGSS